MRFFLHDMEELYNRGNNGNNGNTVTSFHSTKNIFVSVIYRDRTISNTF